MSLSNMAEATSPHMGHITYFLKDFRAFILFTKAHTNNIRTDNINAPHHKNRKPTR